MHPPLVVDSGQAARPAKTEANNRDIAYLTCSPRVPARDRRPAPRHKMDVYPLNWAFAVISALSGWAGQSDRARPAKRGNLPWAANPGLGPAPAPVPATGAEDRSSGVAAADAV